MSKALRLGLSAIVCVLLLTVNVRLNAQSGIYDRMGIVPGHGFHGSLPEENIDLFTGNVTLSYLDIYLPGPNGLDVKVWRVYNSKILKDRQSGQSASIQAYHQSWVGMGWTMHMGMVHQYASNNPVIEFPDGRRETAFLDNYGIGKNITKDFLKYDRAAYKLYFKDGVIWTFGAQRTITLADGTSDPVRLVTTIENAYGHSITVAYASGSPTISSITDATGRVISFLTTGNPKKLTQIKVKNYLNQDVYYNYSVDTYPNGYYRLASFTPPELPATTFEYNDGTSNRYELKKLTTSFGGVLEYSYVNHDFYFNTTYLDSRVVSQKKITFNAGEQANVWNYTYPSYNGVVSGTVNVQGPEFNTDITYNAYDSNAPWKIGLISAGSLGDGSYSETYTWTFQEISNDTWTVLGTSMGTAKGPLLSTVIKTPLGDATLKNESLYERTDPMRYGLPTKVKYYVNGSANAKSYKELTYFFESRSSFKDKYLLLHVSDETDRDGGGNIKKRDHNLIL